jgi:hypothetical protein
VDPRSSPTLTVPADPTLAITVRVFAAAAARRLGLDADSIDDLRLAASELFASAVEAGFGEFEIGIEGSADQWRLVASRAGDLDRAPDGVPFRRRDLLTSLFGPFEVLPDGRVIISGTSTA